MEVVDLVMETLVVVNQHRNQYYGSVKPNGTDRYGSSSPSRNFRDINCRTFQSGAGILPTPMKSFSTPVTKQSSSHISIHYSSSSKTPSPTVNTYIHSTENATPKSNSKTKPIAINFKTARNGRSFSENFSNEFESFSYSELWAGPAYSNSPPPSSLPIPKFSMRPKRTVSLELPVTHDYDRDIKTPHSVAKSAPASPTRERGSGSSRDIFNSADSATKTLRRILNLDNAEE